MIETKRAANGAGIAANQVGETLRIAIVEVEPGNPRYPYKPAVPLTVVVNPELEPVGDEQVEIVEGCLSVPDLRGAVPRCEVGARPLPRPRRRAARGGPPRAHGGHVPARGRPPRRGPLPRPRAGPDDVLDLGARASAFDRDGVERAREIGRSTARRVERLLWCELAWLGGEAAEPGCCSRSTASRLDRVTPGVAAAGRRLARSRAHAPRPRQRALARVPARAARPHARGRGLVLDLARADVRARRARSTPTRASRSRAPRSARWRSPGSPASASSTTCTTRPTARPTTTRTRWAARCSPPRARPGCGSRCSTRATCTAGIERFRDRDAAAWVERVDALAERGPARGRRGHPQRPRGRPGRRARGRRVGGGPAAARARLRAAEGERGHARRARPHADGAARRRGRARRALHRRPRDAPDRRGRRAARRRRRHGLPVPDDRARPRRRHRPGARGSPTRAPRSPRAPTRTRSSTCSRRRARSSSTSASPPASAAPTARPTCCAPRPPAATPRSAGPTAAASSRARSPTSPRSRSTPCGSRARAPEHAAASAVFAATAADVRDVMVGGEWIVRDGAHLGFDVAGRAARGASAGV